eukprot:TRINITY_DN13042_c0_g3_i1.p1 TRINITY_DN13042_c0_g3~~TRINITY_DN13042_c0_g3_i1.p1  ORF type:complete len:858 (-),score=93.15 TRINITY_DN13042_c0_g3_i1:85-2658(-)
MALRLCVLLLFAIDCSYVDADTQASLVDASHSPAGRSWHAMASVRPGVVLMFGGRNDSDQALSETWLFNMSSKTSGTWTQVPEGTGPAGRVYHAMASVGDDKVLLFGGHGDGILEDTWLFSMGSGTPGAWMTVWANTLNPEARYGHAMARIGPDKVLLFGGGTSTPDHELQDTWLFAIDRGWTELPLEKKPSKRLYHGMASLGQDEVLLFGGLHWGKWMVEETWLFTMHRGLSGAWTQLSLEAKPRGMLGLAMVSVRKDEVLLFGGASAASSENVHQEMWLFTADSTSSGAWVHVSPEPSLSPRQGMAMASGPEGDVLLFGGFSAVSCDTENKWNDLWIFANVSAARGACGLGRTTLELGLSSSTECFCEAGRATHRGEPSCQPCPKGQFCPLDDMDEPKDCPPGKLTADKGKPDVSDCLCRAGYGIEPSNPDICTLCANGTYKATLGNDVCTPCPRYTTSGRGATSREECYCIQGYYLEDPNYLEPCRACMDGVVCEGGIDPLTGEHRLPYADPGYFLTGRASAVACPQMFDGAEICKGGGSSRTAPCKGNCSECLDGHDGFICQNCKPGWARNTADERCRPCEDLLQFGAGNLIVWLNAHIILHSLMAHVQTVMAIIASQGAKTLHTALFRLLQTWLLSVTVITQYNYSQVEMFSWGNEAMMKMMPDNYSHSSERSSPRKFNAVVPGWFSKLVKYLFFLDLQMDTGKSVACLAEHFFRDEGQEENDTEWWTHALPAMYHIAYPILLIFWTIVLDGLLVYAVWETLKRTGILPVTDHGEREAILIRASKEAASRVVQEGGQRNSSEDPLSQCHHWGLTACLCVGCVVSSSCMSESSCCACEWCAGRFLYCGTAGPA